MDSIKALKIEYNEVSEEIREVNFKLKHSTLTPLDRDFLIVDLELLKKAQNKLHAKISEFEQ